MLIDMHIHTSEVSACSQLPWKQILDTYKSLGYDGLVITNHLNPWTKGLDSAGSWDEFVDFYVGTVDAAKEYGKTIGIKVFMGCELRFYDEPNDFLVYGMTAEFLKAHPDIMSYGIGKFYSVAHPEGILVYQAHPFRDGMSIVRRKYLDGVEIFNGHPYHNSRNDVARLWADLHGYMMVSGSDCHYAGCEGTAGMLFDEDFDTEAELVEALKAGKFRLVINAGGGLGPARERDC